MLGLRRRKRTAGWAIDVSDGEAEAEQGPLLRRFTDSNKAWIVCLIAIVFLTFFLIKNSHRTIGGSAPITDPGPAPSEFRDRSRYTSVEAEFLSDRRFAETVLEARFLTPGRLQIVVSRGVSADEIDYVAKMAAERVRHLFHHRTVVSIYKTSPKSDTRTLVATAQWQQDKHSYVVRFLTSAEGSP